MLMWKINLLLQSKFRGNKMADFKPPFKGNDRIGCNSDLVLITDIHGSAETGRPKGTVVLRKINQLVNTLT